MNKGVVKITSDVALEDWPDFPEAAIEEGSRGQRGVALFEDPSCSVGVWGALPNKTAPLKFTYTEYMVILGGGMVIVDQATGQSRAFKQGDCCLVPAGFQFRWQQSEEIKKVYFVVEEDPSADSAPSRGPVSLADASPSLSTLSSESLTYATTYRDRTARFSAGLLSASPAETHPALRPWPRTELLHVSEGQLLVQHQCAGEIRLEVVNRRDSVLIPAGVSASIIAGGSTLAQAYFAAAQTQSNPAKL